MSELLKIDHIFDDYRRFPWDVLGIFIPKVGPVHSYLCTILAPWVEEYWREFMRGKPTMSELRRAARASQDSTMDEIVKYCDQLYQYRPSERTDVADEVLMFLGRHKGFVSAVQKRLDHLYRSGLISVPREMRPLVKHD